MRKKASFFLLEVILAIALVGIFVVYFLRSSLQQLIREQKELAELESEWSYDLRRMEIITLCWKEVQMLPKRKGRVFQVNPINNHQKLKIIKAWCPNEIPNYYHLVLEEETEKEKKKKIYHFLVKKPNCHQILS